MSVKINLPTDIKIITAVEAKRAKSNCGISGVYVIYDKEDVPLYVGKSRHVYSRVRDHVLGNSHIGVYRNQFDKIKIYLENDPFLIEMYETYLIHEIKPRYNSSKVFHEDMRISLECKIDEITAALDQLEEDKEQLIAEIKQSEYESLTDSAEDEEDMETLGDHLLNIGRLRDINRRIRRLRARRGVYRSSGAIATGAAR